MSKEILLFSDLEGTILRESDNQYDDEAMYNFLLQISNLQEITDAKVHMHLVSPIYPKHMEKILDKIDTNTSRFNTLHKDRKEVLYIEGAAAYPEDLLREDRLDNRILPLKNSVSRKSFDLAQYGKYNYVKSWYEICSKEKNQNVIMLIYCGNGRNDIQAMDFVNSTRKGFVICPQNSRHIVKEKAFYVSPKTDLPGITEGISMINKELEKRIKSENINKDEEQK